MTVLLEREAELDALARSVARARGGAGELTLIEGPAGIGKSALLQALRESAEGVTVLTARAAALEREFAFGLCLQWFEPALAALGTDERADVLAGSAGYASSLLNGGAERLGGDEALFAHLHGLYWVCSNLAERGPLLLAGDDLQWADLPTLRFLLYLAQRLDGLPVAVVVTRRTGEPDAPDALLAELAATATVVRPEPLSERAVTELVHDRVPDATGTFCQACTEVTGGNPFLLRELLLAITAEGVEPSARSVEALAGLAPDAVLRSVVGRLRRFPDPDRDVARALAVLGEGGPAELAGLAGVGLEDAVASTDRLRAAAILDGEVTRFAHPLLRSAIYADIPEGARGLLHLRAARLVDPARAAAHLLVAPATGDAWAQETLRAAGARALAAGAPASAVPYLVRALDEGGERAAVLLELAAAEAGAGLPEATGRLDEALTLTTDAVERARILERLAWMLHYRGAFAEASQTLLRALEELGERDPDLAVALEIAYVGVAWQVAALAEDASVRRSRLVRAAAGRPAARPLLAQLAFDRLVHGDDREGMLAACREFLATGGALHAEVLDVWIVVGCLSWGDELLLAEATIDAAEADALASGATLMAPLAAYGRSWPALWRGRVADAAADARIAVDAWRGGWGMYLPAAIHWLALSHLERDEIDEAEAALDLPEQERWARGSPYVLWLAARGRVAWARGDLDSALTDLVDAGAAAVEVMRFSNPAVLPWRSDAALVSLALGDRAGARRLAREEVELARRFGAARPLGIALRALGLVENDLERLAEAVGVLERSPSRLELARALVDLGAALRRDNHRREAREPLRRALDMATSFGAHALVARAREELEATGARVRREALTGRDALTPSELRVCRLAAEGLSNREIAQRLFVTVAAVKWHLRHAYAKLDIAAREELAGALAD